ncbi:MAG: SDR family NAD(P)-dependent oxidoreductase [Kineosporiaceae bacterium]
MPTPASDPQHAPTTTGRGPRADVALVTGATWGLGLEFAERLAARGDALVLVARDADRLAEVAEGLRARHGVAVEVLAADLATDAGCEAVAARLADPARPVDLLVNNAGAGLGVRAVDADPAAVARLDDLLTRAVLRLSLAAVGPMAHRGHGGVVNVASVAAFLPGGVYTAAKAWVVAFTRGLSAELRGTGVRAVVVCPGYVPTRFHASAGIDTSRIPSWWWIPAERVVAETLAALADGRPTVVVPSRRYRVLVALVRHAPLRLGDALWRSRGGRLPLRD